jgi:hypothetical protein
MAVKFNPFSGQFDMVGDKAISQVLTGYTSGAGTVASTDTILQALQKLNGNDALAISQVLTGYTSGAGTVSASDTILQAIQKLNGNDALAISQVLTGYTSGAGTVSASDTILQAIQKLNGNDALKLPLAGGTISGNVIPNTNNTLDLGSTTGPKFFANVYSTAYTGSSLSILDTGTTYRLAIDSPSTTILRLGGAAAWAETRINSSTVSFGNSVCTLSTLNTGVNMTITTVQAGDLLLQSGAYTGATSTGGSVKLFSGNATNTGGNSGNVLIYTGTSSSGTRGSIAIGNFTPTTGYNLELRTNAIADVGFVVRGFGTGGSYTQTGDLQKWQSYDGTTATDLIRIDSSGALAGNNTSGTNAIGGNLTIKAGAGTGTGVQSTSVPATINFQTPTQGTTGSTAQALAVRLKVGAAPSAPTVATQMALWFGNAAITSTNQNMIFDGGSIYWSVPTGNSHVFRTAASGNNLFTINATGISTNNAGLVYRTSNGGSNINAHFFIDPANTVATAGALGYAWDTSNGMSFTHANGTLRIRGWSVMLTNLVNTAGSESSDLTWTPQNVIDKFIIGGAFNLNQLTGTTSRMMEVDTNGNVVASEPIIPWLFSNATDQTNITTRSGWNLKGVYSGTAMTAAEQNQWYYDADHIYGMLDNSTPFNIPRYSKYKLLNNSVTTTGTPASTTETDLFSYTVPASTLNNDLEILDGVVSGTFAANANNKQIKVYFGGTVIFDSSALAFNNGTWTIEFDIIRESSTVVRCNARFTSDLTTLSSSSKYTRITGLTLSSTNILKVTGTNGTASANDATGNMFKVSWQSAT